MRTLNLGILAHIDAGKTSLTERLLHSAGVIDTIGRVDEGSTTTDTLALERQRGITIKSAVVSFPVDGITVNLLDTPGHPDFIAEVERVLSVLDGAVLVVSAVEGVQAQTRVLMRTLRRLRIPTLVFVNKIDRAGAQGADVRLPRAMAEKLAPSVVPMGSTTGLGCRDASFVAYGPGDTAFTSALAEHLAEHDEALLAAYVDDEKSLSHRGLRRELAAQTRRALTHPVFYGSAITGAGVDALIAGIAELLPAVEADPEAPLSGSVFKVERGPAGEKIAYLRVAAGTVRTRDTLPFRGPGEEHGAARGEGRVTGLTVFDHGTDVREDCLAAGRIGKVRGLADIRVGDTVGAGGPSSFDRYFAPPTLETEVVPAGPGDRAALHVALAQLAEQDPLIDYRRGELRQNGLQDVYVSLYGEVQKEVIQATLEDEYGIGVTFRETTTICLERPAGTGAAAEFIGKEPNPFLATVGLRVDPAPVGSGVDFRLEVELGSMPYSFIKAVEETVRETLRQGLRGWQVTDLVVTLTHSGYYARQSHAHGVFDKSMSSTAGDFRNLTPLVLMTALTRAGTRVYQPMHHFRLDLPADTYGQVLPLLAKLGAVPGPPVVNGTAAVLEGGIPAASVHGLEQRISGLTRGEGLMESAFDHYEPVRGPVPRRERWDNDPLDRRGYLLRVLRRVAGRGGGV